MGGTSGEEPTASVRLAGWGQMQKLEGSLTGAQPAPLLPRDLGLCSLFCPFFINAPCRHQHPPSTGTVWPVTPSPS